MKYEKAKVEIVKFENEDVVTASFICDNAAQRNGHPCVFTDSKNVCNGGVQSTQKVCIFGVGGGVLSLDEDF